MLSMCCIDCMQMLLVQRQGVPPAGRHPIWQAAGKQAQLTLRGRPLTASTCGAVCSRLDMAACMAEPNRSLVMRGALPGCPAGSSACPSPAECIWLAAAAADTALPPRAASAPVHRGSIDSEVTGVHTETIQHKNAACKLCHWQSTFGQYIHTTAEQGEASPASLPAGGMLLPSAARSCTSSIAPEWGCRAAGCCACGVAVTPVPAAGAWLCCCWAAGSCCC